MTDSADAPNNPLLALIDLGHKARNASTREELLFLLVNDSRRLSPYRQAFCYSPNEGITHVSGVLKPEKHSPLLQWNKRLCEFLSGKDELSWHAIGINDLPEVLQEGWAKWLPSRAWWMPFTHQADDSSEFKSGVLVCADELNDELLPLWKEWIHIWSHACDRLDQGEQLGLKSLLRQWWQVQVERVSNAPQRTRRIWAGSLLAFFFFPVPLTVVGSGELVPRNPVVVRAPLDGVINEFHVSPNQKVKAGDSLFSYDNQVVRSRFQVAQQSLAAAQAEYRQSAQSAFTDTRARYQLAGLIGKVQEKQAELQYLTEQVNRTTVTASQAGIVLFDEVSEWIGRPVQTGERVVRLADPRDSELEVWINLADAVTLENGNGVKLFLTANPFNTVSGEIIFVGYEAQPRPDGTFAFRVRAKIDGKTDFPVGSKGTARVSAGFVPLSYWIFRKPLAVIRGYLLI